MTVNGPSNRIVSISATPRWGTSRSGVTTVPVASSHIRVTLSSPSRTVNNGLGRWASAGVEAERVAISTSAAASRSLWVRVIPAAWSARYCSRSRRVSSPVTMAPSIAVEGAVEAHGAVQGGGGVQRGTPVRAGRVLVAGLGVGQLHPVLDGPHRVGVAQRGALLDEQLPRHGRTGRDGAAGRPGRAGRRGPSRSAPPPPRRRWPASRSACGPGAARRGRSSSTSTRRGPGGPAAVRDPSDRHTPAVSQRANGPAVMPARRCRPAARRPPRRRGRCRRGSIDLGERRNGLVELFEHLLDHPSTYRTSVRDATFSLVGRSARS